MKNKLDIMIDLETFGNTPNAAISQIAAVVFNRYTGHIVDKLFIKVDVQSCIDYGMTIDASTVEWWLIQSEEARKSIIEGEKNRIENALYMLSNFINQNLINYFQNYDLKTSPNKDKINIWCHTTFDEPILKNAYIKVKIDIPWQYKSGRDLRTLVDLADYSFNKNENSGIAHNALDDCLFQVSYAVKCFNILRDRT